MRTGIRILTLGIILVVSILFGGCRAKMCTMMTACCDRAERDLEDAVGQACGELADNVRDPDTCRTIVQTVRHMYEDRDQEVPEACGIR